MSCVSLIHSSQAITNDLTTLELKEAAAQAEHIREEDLELEESLEVYEFERTSRLTEPDKWLTEQFVVADPFIFEKVMVQLPKTLC